MPDSDVRHLQVRGSARFSGFIRGQLASERFRRRTKGALARARLDVGEDDRRTLGLSLAVWGGVAVVLAVGSRHLVTRGLPAVHQLGPFPGAWSLLRSYASGWNQAGLGSEAPAPAAFGLLGLAGLLLGGATGLLRTLIVVGALPLGAAGAAQLAAPLGSQRARLAALVVYVAIPLPYNALAGGRLFAVIAYGVAPWVLRSLLRATGIAPFAGPDDDDSGVRRVVLPLGLLLAVVAALAPPIAVMVVLVGLGLAAGSVLAGDARRAVRAAVAAVAAVGVAAVLLFPWSVDFVTPGSQLSAVTGIGGSPARAVGLGTLLRFQTGPLGAPPIGWVFVAAAALPLLVGRDWRLAWAARLWILAITCWAVAWAGGRGWLRVSMPAAEVLLAPAAAALALAVALGLLAFEVDVPGYRFGWRQLAPTATLVAVLLGAVPVAASALGGRWNVPREDFAGLLSWMPEQRVQGAFRVLWLGDPEALPLTGWRLADGVAYATSRNGAPDATGLWPGASPRAAERVADALNVARADGTTGLGHLLAPEAIRYLVVPLRAAPDRTRSRHRRAPPARRPPPDVPAALDAQVDLKKLQGDDALLVYENAAWAPGRAKLPAGARPPDAPDLASLRGVELAGSVPVLASERTPTRFSGPLGAGDSVLLSEASSSRWRLEVAGKRAARTTGFGWANRYSSPASGPATLRYRTSVLRYGALLVQVALWVLAVRELYAARRRRTAAAR